MPIKIYLKSKSNTYYAEGTYSDGMVTVMKGAKIQLDFAIHIRGGTKAKNLRSDKTIVDETGTVIKDCIFSSPSTAAQFITGRSTNGYVAWHIDKKTTLGKYLGRE